MWIFNNESIYNGVKIVSILIGGENIFYFKIKVKHKIHTRFIADYEAIWEISLILYISTLKLIYIIKVIKNVLL